MSRKSLARGVANMVIPAVFLFAYGCAGTGQPNLKVDYYTLEYQAGGAEAEHVLPVVIEVKRFSVSPEVNSDRIIFRDSNFRRNEYVYHRWRANPADLVTFHLARDLRTSGFFSGVYALSSSMEPTHFLEGTVDGFHEEDGPDRWDAVLSIHLTLIDRMEPDITRRILFQKEYTEREPCTRKNPEALVEALSRGMARLSDRAASDLRARLAEPDREAGGH